MKIKPIHSKWYIGKVSVKVKSETLKLVILEEKGTITS